MKILYLNPWFTSFRLHAKLPGLPWQEFAPPYDQVVSHIAPDVVVRECKGRFSDRPTGSVYREIIEGREIEALGRPIGPGDELIFLSLAHLFHKLYEHVIDNFVDLKELGADVRFWKEELFWDFQNNEEGASDQMWMLKAMNGYVLYKEEMAVERYKLNQARVTPKPET